MKTKQFYNKHVWITGASSGIGRSVALEFSRRGAILAISGRDKKALQNLADNIDTPDCLILDFDATNRQANHDAVETINRLWGKLDIALFNAGTAEYVDINHFDADVFKRLIDTNYMSMVYGIEAVLPLLRNSHQAKLGGMSSTVAYAGVPRAEAYGASKAAVRNMMQALRAHLAHQNIDVFTVCPGFVKTPLTAQNDFSMPMLIEADKAAQLIVDGIAANKAEIHFPKIFSLLYKLLAALPASIYTRIATTTVRKT